jgi:hypothetical protein
MLEGKRVYLRSGSPFTDFLTMAHKPLQSNFDVDYVISYRMPKDGTEHSLSYGGPNTDILQTRQLASRSSRSSSVHLQRPA